MSDTTANWGQSPSLEKVEPRYSIWVGPRRCNETPNAMQPGDNREEEYQDWLPGSGPSRKAKSYHLREGDTRYSTAASLRHVLVYVVTGHDGSSVRDKKCRFWGQGLGNQNQKSKAFQIVE